MKHVSWMRFTVRRMMVAVAAVAIVIWGVQTASRWRLYRERAEYHASEQARLRAELSPYMEYRREAGEFPGCGMVQIWMETDLERAEWNARLSLKYQRAAFRPWLSLDPDPPAPQ